MLRAYGKTASREASIAADNENHIEPGIQQALRRANGGNRRRETRPRSPALSGLQGQILFDPLPKSAQFGESKH